MIATYTTTAATNGRWYTMTTTSTTCSTTTMDIWYSCTTSNVQWVSQEEPPAPPPEYLKLMPVVLYRDCRRAQLCVGRVSAPLARSKIRSWKSLKEKRQGWGLS